ncbi:OB-fold protein [Sorangium sp. So ce854]|uniref:OB-fold protein n=1 Tax=Sorangium sp. So ce854 TaxID=3133322 RepID=UPI003F6422B0
MGLGLLWTSPSFSKNGKVGLTIVVGILCFIGAVGALNAPKTSSVSTPTTSTLPATGGKEPAAASPAAPSRPEVQALKVKASDLMAAYKGNEVRADGQYKGKMVETTGVVNDIGKDILDDIYIIVGTGGMLEIPALQASFTKQHEQAVASLSKGDRVTLRCKVKGLMMHVQLDDCAFVK